MKKATLLCALLIFLLLPAIALTAYAPPGSTDGRGGHTDNSTGEYHYHHGYPAHDHYDIDGDGDIDCPYDFEDKTDGNGTTSTANAKAKKGFAQLLPGVFAVGLYVFFMFILPFLIS